MKLRTLAGLIGGIGLVAASTGAFASVLTDNNKEYSNYRDKNAAGVPTATQIVEWDGLGNATDLWNYNTGNGRNDDEVDAIANQGDAFFADVVTDRAHLLVSVQGDPLAAVHIVHSGSGSVGVWATSAQVNSNGSVNDLDGLEVWGGSDSDRVSFEGDPGRVAVWACPVPGGGACAAFVTDATIAALIGRTDLADRIDLDALMTSGDQLLFSIRPIDVFDGGEIWYWNGTDATASFLVHGGRTWDTANNVTALLGAENVDALEATNNNPTPGTLALLGLGLAGLAGARRRG